MAVLVTADRHCIVEGVPSGLEIDLTFVNGR